MGFRSGNYATCWSVEDGHGNTLKVRLSTSRKNKDGVYEQDFSGFCTFIGNAKAKGEKLKPKDRIKLGDVDVTTWYSKEKDTEYVTYKVFDFEMADSAGSNHTTGSARNNAATEDVEDGAVEEDNLPF